MRFATRAAGLAVVAALTATVVLFPPLPQAEVAAAQPEAALPADLALVPADAVGFVHVRVMDLWKHEAFASFRQTFEKAGPKALGALDAQFVPKISTFDRLTAFLVLDGERKEPVPVVVLRFTAPFDTDEVVKAYLPGAEKHELGGKTVYRGKGVEFTLHFPDKQHIVLAPPQGMRAYLGHAAPKTGPLTYGLKLAAAGKPIVGSLNLGALPIPPKALDDLPPEVRALLKAEHVTGSLDLGATSRVELTAGYKNADDSQAAEKAVKALAEYARKQLAEARGEVENKLFGAKGPRPAGELPEALLMVFALGALNQVDEMLAAPEKYVKRDGANVTASVPLPKETLAAAGAFVAVGVGLLLPAVQKVREASARMQSANNLKQLALAVHNYHDVYGHLPHDIVDKNGKPILSWRVQILPFIEQNNLYQRFKLDEPWDSPNNKPLSQVMIKVFMSPAVELPPVPPGEAQWGVTNYRGFSGPGAFFEPGKKLKFADVTDGLSNTIMVAETTDSVPWAKPGDIPFDPKKPLPKWAPVYPGGVANAAFGDGAVRAIAVQSIDEKTLKALITRNGGEVADPDK